MGWEAQQAGRQVRGRWVVQGGRVLRCQAGPRSFPVSAGPALIARSHGNGLLSVLGGQRAAAGGGGTHVEGA